MGLVSRLTRCVVSYQISVLFNPSCVWTKSTCLTRLGGWRSLRSLPVGALARAIHKYHPHRPSVPNRPYVVSVDVKPHTNTKWNLCMRALLQHVPEENLAIRLAMCSGAGVSVSEWVSNSRLQLVAVSTRHCPVQNRLRGGTGWEQGWTTHTNCDLPLWSTTWRAHRMDSRTADTRPS